MKRAGREIASGLALVLALVSATLPAWRAQAALIGSETALQAERARELRQAWSASLERAEVRAALEAQGVDPLEAAARVGSLTDEEVLEVAGRLDQLPAGQGAGEVVVAVLIVFAVLVILDATGVTDVFPWIKTQ